MVSCFRGVHSICIMYMLGQQTLCAFCLVWEEQNAQYAQFLPKYALDIYIVDTFYDFLIA